MGGGGLVYMVEGRGVRVLVVGICMRMIVTFG